MSDNLTQNLMASAEKNGWSVAVDKGTEWEFQQHSPAGEDFFFTVWSENVEDVAYEVRKYAREFDTEEHVKMWVSASNTTSGVPDIRTLLDDAEDIQEMLDDLAIALLEVTKEAIRYA